MKKEEIIITDTESRIYKLPKFFRNWFFSKFHHQGMIQYHNEVPVVCGDTVKWLERITVESSSEKRADKLAFEWFNQKYPEYKGFIQLF